MDGGLKKEPVTLKIEISAEREVMTLTLSGRIRAEEVAELERLFEAEGEDHCIVLDLQEVKRVDRDAVRFLALCRSKSTRLENARRIPVNGL